MSADVDQQPLIEVWPIYKLKNWDLNPRAIKGADFEKLKQQILKHGVYKPLIVTKDGTVVGGNMRLAALKELGAKKITVSIVDLKTEKEMLEIALSDNDRAGYYDDDKLLELSKVHAIDTQLYHVDLGEPVLLADHVEAVSPDKKPDQDEVPEADESDIKSKLGVKYRLGDHFLMCGDATSEADVEKLVGSRKVAISFQSPPYNAGHDLENNKNKTKKKNSKYKNSEDNLDNYLELLQKSTELAIRHAQYSFFNVQMLSNNKLDLIAYMYDNRDFINDVIIWDKGYASPAMARRVMNSVFEFIFVLSADGKKRTVGTKDFRGDVPNVYVGPPQRANEFSKLHNATFPIHLPTFVIESFSNKGESVLDLFGGCGTTLIACDVLERTCYTMEIDPMYCDVIRKRYANHIGMGEKWEQATPQA